MTTIRNAGEFLDGASGDTDYQNNGGNSAAANTPFSYPWRGEQYESDKTEAFRFIRQRQYEGEFTTLPEVVRYVYGSDYTEAEYQRYSKRLIQWIERSDWLAKHPTAAKHVAIEATPEAFDSGDLLNSRKASAKNARGKSDCNIKSQTGSKTGESSEGATVEGKTAAIKSHKERARAIVDSISLVGSDNLRSDVREQFVAWRESVEDTYSIFRSTMWWKDEDEYLILPYLSRFNDSERAKRTRERLYNALSRTVTRFDEATLVTLTVDPKRVDSQSEAMERLSEAWQKLNSRLDYQLGGNVPKARTLEFQGNGMPHLHVALFGVRKIDSEPVAGEATISTEQVRQWWDTEYNVASQIAVQPVRKRGDRWILHESDDGSGSLRYYMGKASRKLVKVASMSERQLADAVGSGDLDVWQVALAWVHERQLVSCSPSLKADSDDESDLPPVTCWEYVGSARYEQIPRGVLQRATIYNRDRRPPPTGGSGNQAVAT